jgi:N-terminal acetyltransferase B complex non-catalytic subunit
MGQTWTVDIHLQQHSSSASVLRNIMEKAHLQPIGDTQLLAYMYRMYIEVLRRAEGTPRVNSIGNAALGTWQATAKNMQRKLDRIAMWDLLFYTAMGEDCWEDVRFVRGFPAVSNLIQRVDQNQAILNYNKEGPQDKKQFHYSLIIATQISAEQTTLWKGSEDRIAQFQQHFVIKSMKQAYTAPPVPTLAIFTVSSGTDLIILG